MKHLYTPSFTIFRCDFLYITEIRESIDIWIGYDDEITTTTTITSKRPTFGYTGFTSPRDNTISSISGTEFHIYCIDEHN
jgi:hypothetical protein